EELKVGDQVRALGDKSADGTHLTAEEIVFGSFRLAGGTVTAIDPATGEVKINDLKTKQPLVVMIKSDSVLRRLPENFGMFGGGMGPGGAGGAGGAGGQGGARPPQNQAQSQRPQGERPPGGGPGGPPGGGT